MAKVKIRPEVATVPLDGDVADSLTEAEKDWLRSWNRHEEIPGEEPPEDSTADDDTEDDSDGWSEDDTVEELQDELRKRELPVSGNKAELIARLEEDDENS